MESRPWRSHLVLAGGGHAHALVLRRWLMQPRLRPSATRISLVSRHSSLCYSGLVPAVVAGLTHPSACRLDLRRLCSLAEVAFLQAEIGGLDPAGRLLHLEGRPPLPFDVLSLDVGALTPSGPHEMAVKPLEPFLDWCGSAPPSPRLRGGGASAVEVALALRARGLHPQLLLRGTALHLGSAAANRLAEHLLAEAAIPIHHTTPPEQPVDLACTGSQAPPWLAASGLPVEAASGRVLTDATLQVVGHPGFFAAGDCGLIASDPRPPSGVWAVRAAPVLASNLHRFLDGRPLVRWRPQRWALQLLGDGGVRDGQPRALAFWGPFALGPSPWLWRWKRHLDQGFMASFAALRSMGAGAGPQEATATMACRGCAAKVPARTLRSALGKLAGLEVGAHAPWPEDAPLLRALPSGERLLQSVDGFPAVVRDPWLNGRLTTLHACSDLWACGARVESAQVVVTVPEGSASVQEDLLLQSLAGVRSVLDPLGATLLGGHTLEGRDGAGLTLALTVNGLASRPAPWAKGPLRAGDALVLSRPLGSGVLLAAAMAGAALPEWVDQALALMQQCQAPLVAILAAHGCHACTDITGFGLLGHLGEMESTGAAPSGETQDQPAVVVELDGSAIPAFAGVATLLARGYASTLAPANAEALRLLKKEVRLLSPPSQLPLLEALLVDPQTCGPLLAALPGDQAEAALQAMHAAGFHLAAVIGRVCAHP